MYHNGGSTIMKKFRATFIDSNDDFFFKIITATTYDAALKTGYLVAETLGVQFYMLGNNRVGGK